MADPVTATLLAIGASAGTAAAVGTAITVASTAFTLYSAFQTVKLPDGPRLGDLSFQSSTYGQAIPRVYGTDIVKGNVIWMRDNQIQENFKTKKLGKKSKQKIPVYTATYALALGEGVVTRINKIWIDGKIAYRKENGETTFKLKISELAKKNRGNGIGFVIDAALLALNTDEDDFNDFNFKFHNGDFTQEPNPIMQGFDSDVSAFRGICYLFFNRLDLEPYGNRIPDMTIELFREAPVEEETDLVAFDVVPKQIAVEDNSVGYSLLRYSLNETIVPKSGTPTVSSALDWYTTKNPWNATISGEGYFDKCLPSLKYCSETEIIYSFTAKRFGKPKLNVPLAFSEQYSLAPRASYKVSGDSTIYTSKEAFYIIHYNPILSDKDVTSLASESPITGTVMQGFNNPKIFTVYPWDFPFSSDENLLLVNETNYILRYDPLTIPVINSPDLYMVFYVLESPDLTPTYHLGLLKVTNGRVIIKRLTGLAETMLPDFTRDTTEIYSHNWNAIQLNGKIYFYCSAGYYKPLQDLFNPIDVDALDIYLQRIFKGFASFKVPNKWGRVNEANSSPTLQSFLTTVRTNNGFYTSKVGLSEDSQITDWEYIDSFSPKAFFHDDENQRTLIINEKVATPVGSTYDEFLANLELCSLDSTFSSIDETFTFDFVLEHSGASQPLYVSGLSRFTSTKIYTFLFNKCVTLDRSDFSYTKTTPLGTYVSGTFLNTMQLVYNTNDGFLAVEGDYEPTNYIGGGYFVRLRPWSFLFDTKTNADKNNGVITLGEIVGTEIKSTGFLSDSDIDVSEGTSNVSGIVFSRQGSILANLQALAEAYFFFLYEEDYKVKLALRQNLMPKATITDDFLNAREVGQTGFKLKNNRPSSFKMPAIFEVSYRDPALLYEVNTQYFERAGYDEPTKQNIELAMALSSNSAKNIVLKIIKQVYLQNEGEWELTLPGIYSHLEAGHLIVVDSEEYGQYELLIKTIDKGRPGIVKITGVKENPDIYGDTTIDFEAVVFEEKLPYKQNVSFVIIDSLPFEAVQDGIGFWVAAWNDLGKTSGYGLIQSEDNFLTYESVEAFVIRSEPTVLMATSTPTDATLTGVYNTAGSLKLTSLNVESFASVAIAQAYTAFYGNENRWEIIKFTDVVDNGDGTYTISNILRGYKGTEIFIDTHQIGDYLVVIDFNLTKLNYSEDKLGNTYQYKIVVPGESNIDKWPTFTKTLTGFGREPLPVAHLTGSRDNSGNLTINWVDQVRYNTQLRDRVESFSDENTLSFTLAILDATDNVVRAVTINNASTYIYTDTMQISDFGSLQTSVKVAITKDSQTMGTGLLQVQTV